jgi:XTP/dITP diphosphohydrolase
VRRLLVATTNRGKQREFRRLLARLPAQVVTPDEVGLDLDVPEPHETYAENARAKASAFAEASGILTLADDSGLEVAALGWGPGPRTGRYGGPAVTDPVGYLLDGVADADDRRARMVCVLALGIPGGGDGPRVEVFSGVVEGEVARERRGAGGFGFDPIFLLPNGLTTAELPEDEKDRISHRGRAVQAATPRLTELLALDPQ